MLQKLFNFWSCDSVVLTISLVSFSVAKMGWQQSYALWSQQIVKRLSEKDKQFSPFAKHCECMLFIGLLLGTHLLFKDCQQKQMDDHLLWLAATVVESKLTRLCSCLLICLSTSWFAIAKRKVNVREVFVFITYKYEWLVVDNESWCRKSSQVYLHNSKDNRLKNFPFHNQQAAFRSVSVRNTFVAVWYNIRRNLNSAFFWHRELKLVRGFK